MPVDSTSFDTVFILPILKEDLKLSPLMARQQFEERIRESRKLEVVIDLSLLEILSLEMLGTILATYLFLRRLGGELKLAHPKPSVRIALEMTRVHHIIEIHPSVVSAARAYTYPGEARTGEIKAGDA